MKNLLLAAFFTAIIMGIVVYTTNKPDNPKEFYLEKFAYYPYGDTDTIRVGVYKNRFAIDTLSSKDTNQISVYTRFVKIKILK